MSLLANLSDTPCDAPVAATGRVLFETQAGVAENAATGPLPGWAVAVLLEDAATG
jgi:uncharacterized membrane protein